MKLRNKVFLWYIIFVFIAAAIAVTAGAALFQNSQAALDSPATAFWKAYAVSFPLIIFAAIGGAYLLRKKQSKSFVKLSRVTDTADTLPLTNAIPTLRIGENDSDAAAILRIYEFIKRRHGKLQQVLHFSSLASHELRTPLTIIRNQLEDGLQTDVSLRHLKDIVASVYDEIIRLHHLVNDLLTISTLQAGTLRLDKSEIEFQKFIKEFYDEALLLSREKNISIILSRGPNVTIVCDPMRMRQVFFNLLDNALKYTPRQGKIHISYRTYDNQLEIKISDTGPGISSSQIGKIFEPFFQVTRHNQEIHQGAGLGLSLVQWIIEEHGGEVDVESEEGNGATFTIKLPLNQ